MLSVENIDDNSRNETIGPAASSNLKNRYKREIIKNSIKP